MEWIRGQTIGRGSSATVSVATSRQSGDLFAVKSVEIFRSEFLKREQRILSSLNCPQIVKYLGSDITAENGKLMYNLFMEYVSGGTLTEAIQKKGGCLDEFSIKSHICEILLGLEYLHSKGLVHCDIKGRNILIGQNGAKIADLGCARWLDEESGASTTPIAGTPLFMGPEVARGEEQGCPADVWALGCTIIEMATGRAPWTDVQDPVSALYRIAFSEEVPEFPSFLSEKAKDFLSKCLRRDPKQRWTANQLLKHSFLDEFISDSKQIEVPRTNSPTSILDLDFWDSMEVSETPRNLTHTSCSNSAIERLRLISSPRKPNWRCDDDWITIRDDDSEESSNFSSQEDDFMRTSDEPTTSSGSDSDLLDQEEEEVEFSGSFDFEKDEFSCFDYKFSCNSRRRNLSCKSGSVVKISKRKFNNLNFEIKREFLYVFFKSNSLKTLNPSLKSSSVVVKMVITIVGGECSRILLFFFLFLLF